MKNIKFLVLDVDGVLTDGGMYYTESGDEFKKFNAKDGLAIRRLTKAGIPVGIISHGHLSKLINKRAELLGIKHVYVGMGVKKMDILINWCNELKIDLNDVAYIGDDINDLEVLQAVGVSACPDDAVFKVKNNVHHVLQNNGGQACVREFIDEYFPEIME
jgi:YrbI family 3-deoxy-D-manno-octulosonate 8-phosphate phosphatase